MHFDIPTYSYNGTKVNAYLYAFSLNLLYYDLIVVLFYFSINLKIPPKI